MRAIPVMLPHWEGVISRALPLAYSLTRFCAGSARGFPVQELPASRPHHEGCQLHTRLLPPPPIHSPAPHVAGEGSLITRQFSLACGFQYFTAWAGITHRQQVRPI